LNRNMHTDLDGLPREHAHGLQTVTHRPGINGTCSHGGSTKPTMPLRC
jgi:hypothetical protein